MARITWQNVDAPNFAASIEAQSMGSNAFAKAMDSIGGVLSGIGAERKNALNAAALEKMLSYQDTGAWDNAMRQGALASLGIRPDQATEGLLTSIAGRRNELEQDRTSNFDYGKALYDQGRVQIGDERADLTHNRGEEERQRGLDALARANAAIEGTTSPEEARLKIRKMGLGAQDEAATFGALDQMDPVHWGVSADAKILDPTTQDQINLSNATLQGQQRERDIAFQADPLLQLYSEAPSKYAGYGSALNGLTERLGATVAQEDKENFSKSKGNVAKVLNRFTAAYPNVPEAVVAMVMENQMKQTGLGWLWDDNITFDTKKIEEQLADMNNPQRRKDLELQSQRYTNETAQNQKDVSAIQRLNSEILVLQENGGSPEAIAKKAGQIKEIHDRVGTGATDPATQLLNSARGQNALVSAAATAPVQTILAQALEQGAPVDRDIPDAAPAKQTVLEQVAASPYSSLLDVVMPMRAQNRMMRQQQGAAAAAQPVVAAPVAAPAVTSAPAAPVTKEVENLVVSQAMESPEASLELVGVELGFSPREVDNAMTALSTLSLGSMDASTRKIREEQVKTFVSKARDRAKNASPEVRALVDRAEEWLRLPKS